MLDQNLIVGLVVVGVVAWLVYANAPRFRSMLSGMEGYQNAPAKKLQSKMPTPGANPSVGATNAAKEGAVAAAAPHVAKVPAAAGGKEGFADYASFDSTGLGPVPMAGAAKPAGCYPREQLNPAQLLPQDVNSQWAAVNPTGAGDLQGKNFLSAGALIGVNTVGQSMRNANLQLRSEPPNPQIPVSPWLVSTIEPDLARRSLE